MKIQVLMSTYNGEKFLREQLDSILKQNIQDISIIIRDDGSKDSTIDILNEYSKKYNNIKYYIGNNVGPAKSFLELLDNPDYADYYCFCDQDDVWLENKISIALSKLNKNINVPSMYYSEVNIVDKKLNFISKSYYSGIDSIGASFVTTPVIGCTLVINRKLRNIVIKQFPKRIAMHDSWIYRICLGVNGIVIHDYDSYIKYRQHENNVIGISTSKIEKIKKYFHHKGNRTWTAQNLLKIFNEEIPDENKKIIFKIANFKKNINLFYKFNYIFDKNFKTYKFKSDLKFCLDILFNKL